MNKFTSLMMGAALLSLSACSSEELVIDTPDIPQEGSALYLAVNIKSGDMSSRADEIGEDDKEWGFKYGDADEHAVERADFYFFDVNGIYLAQADVWKEGSENTNPSTPSVEYISSNMLVLRGLTEKNPPKYMITVLNDKTGTGSLSASLIPGVTSMADFREKASTWTVTNKDNKNLMLMTTSSFVDEVDIDSPDLNALKIGATVLDADQLSKEPIDNIATLDKDKVVEVYVERLAAKFTMQGTSTSTIDVTIGGLPNDDADNDASGNTKVKITLTGFNVTCTPDRAYYTKHLVTPLAAGNDAWQISGKDAWNDPTNMRSYWGASYYYNSIDPDDLTLSKFADAAKNLGNAVYANENTKPYTAIRLSEEKEFRVNPALVTNVVFTAKITYQVDGEDVEAKLVNYGGMFYTEDNFMQLILNRASVNNQLNLFKAVTEGTTTKYNQLDHTDFKLVRYDDSKKNAEVKLEYKGDYKELYSYDKDTDKYTEVEDVTTAIETLNGALADYVNPETNKAEYYNGNTYYTIPVEHLLGKDNVYNVTRDGEFGIVRNHWYHFTLNSITKLGHGVFNPEGGEEGDDTYPDPDPEKTTYALAAKVNILSWKIVRQTIDI